MQPEPLRLVPTEPEPAEQDPQSLDRRLKQRPETPHSLPSTVYTTDQLAELVQVSRRAVERWAAAGRIPGRLRLPGRTVRWAKDVIDRWLSEGCPVPVRARKAR